MNMMTMAEESKMAGQYEKSDRFGIGEGVTAFVFDNFYIDCNYYEDEQGDCEYGFDL